MKPYSHITFAKYIYTCICKTSYYYSILYCKIYAKYIQNICKILQNIAKYIIICSFHF